MWHCASMLWIHWPVGGEWCSFEFFILFKQNCTVYKIACSLLWSIIWFHDFFFLDYFFPLVLENILSLWLLPVGTALQGAPFCTYRFEPHLIAIYACILEMHSPVILVPFPCLALSTIKVCTMDRRQRLGFSVKYLELRTPRASFVEQFLPECKMYKWASCVIIFVRYTPSKLVTDMASERPVMEQKQIRITGEEKTLHFP